MKAITICQPYAELIAVGSKRVENRVWPTNYRGPLLIHAGKSRDWLILDDSGAMDIEYGIPVANMAFGAVVATARLIDCVRHEAIEAGKYDEIYPWVKGHRHAIGPWCWILEGVRRLPNPLPARGAQGLFEITLPGAKQ